ncbi:hypothetical protein [Candidatus Protochlamydia phocaeensis]|uniref:hypothetical protein n=1 Tax=Candidatus Protochlamydia phocaeensis TaxID=1414722 RepID=UPI000838097D|nr:hypothetical protein [Candidatus Protochlamydia phocaeensis]
MIDTSIRPIGLGSDFTPPVRESLISSKSLLVLFLNAITLNFYVPLEIRSKENQIQKLGLNQQHLQRKASKLIKKLEGLEAELDEIRERCPSQSPADTSALFAQVKGELEALKGKSNILRTSYIYANKEVANTVTTIALNCLSFVAHFFANLITLGLYGVYLNHHRKHQIDLLNAENNYIESVINRELRDKRVERFQSQIQTIQASLDNQIEIKEIQQTDPVQARQEIEGMQVRAQEIDRQLRELTVEYSAVRIQKIAVEEQKNGLNRQFNRLNNELEGCRRENQNIQHEITTQRSEVQKLQAECAALQRDIEFAKEAKEQATQLGKQVSALQNIQKRLPHLQRLQSKLGPIPSKYTKQKDDDIIAGAYGIDTPKVSADHRVEIVGIVKEKIRQERELIGDKGPIIQDEDYFKRIEKELEVFWSPYAQRVNKKKTAADLLIAEFDYAFDELCRLGSEPEHERLICFNNSSAIFQDKQFKPNQDAIYRFMALDLIKEAELYQDNCHYPALKLNDQKVLMAPSNPERVQGYRTDSKSGPKVPEVFIAFKHVDEFTPEVGDRELPFGIDPTGAKWAYNRLTQEEREHLFRLLMEPLIPDDHAKMLETQEFMKQSNNERVELVRTAYELIFDIGTVIRKRFADKGLFADQFEAKATDTSYVNSLGMNSSITPLKKDRQGIEFPMQEEGIEPAIIIKPWEFDSTALAAGGDDFSLDFITSFSAYDAIFDKMSESLVVYPIRIEETTAWDNPVRRKNEYSRLGSSYIRRINKYGIEHQYHLSHELFDNHGSLFSNLLAILMSVKNIDGSRVDSLKLVLAKYLDKPENADAFKDEIEEAHGMTVPEYQNWLRGETFGRIRNLNSRFIIRLAAEVFGIRIGVFYPGSSTKLNEYGLMVPAEEQYYYGPNTKHALYLYQESDSKYYGVFPILKKNVLPEPHDSAVRTVRNYWESRIRPSDI